MGSCPNEARRRHSTFAAFFLTGDRVAVELMAFRDLRTIEQRQRDDSLKVHEGERESLQLDIRALAQEDYERFHLPGQNHVCQGCIGVALLRGISIDRALRQYEREQDLIAIARFRGQL